MSKKVFCGGLPWSTEDFDLEQAMARFGTVREAKVVMDRDTGRSRGFGFVTFDDEDAAEEALNAGSIKIENRTVRIDEADEKPRVRRQTTRA